MPVRDQQPAQLTVLHMDPQGASPLPKGVVQARADAAYSSLFSGGAGGGNTFFMDGEILRTDLRARVGLGDGVEVAIELPFAHTSGGFLDQFLIDYHRFFGFPDQDRSTSPIDQWQVRATHQGNTVYEMDQSELALLDVPLTVSWAFLPVTQQRPWGLAVRAGIEAPTGDADRGFGNGGVDGAIGMSGELRQGPLALTAHVQHTFAATPDRASHGGIEFGDVTSGGLEAELALTDTVSLLVQTEAESATLRELGFSHVADPHWLLWTGGRFWLSEQVQLEVGFAEDLSAYVTPDFTAWLGLAVTLGGGGDRP